MVFPSKGSEAVSVNEWVNKRFLLVDDFPSMRQMMRDMLRNIGVRYIDQAASGSEAAAALGRTKYDVVLCDFNLGPGKNGQQVLEEAKVRELIGPTCIWVMVSAEKSVDSIMGAAEYQPDSYLIKPITENTLMSRLNRIWAKKQVFKQIAHTYDVKDYLKAVKLCDEKLATDKIHALDLLRMKATLLEKAGEMDQACAVYEQVMTVREFPWAKAGIAKIRAADGKLELARQMLQEVVAENPHYLEAYDQLADVQQRMGQFEEAEKVLLSAAKLSPNSVLRQKNLGTVALKLGNAEAAEKAFRKSVSVGEHSVLATPESYYGLARVCGQKADAKEALRVLSAVQDKFDTEETRVRAKVVEGLVYHESGDEIKARKSGEELSQLLATTGDLPDAETCLDMARLLFAVGVEGAPLDLLRDVVKNNHDNEQVLKDVQDIFEKASLGDQGAELVGSAKKEAGEMMNRGVILWKGGQLDEAIEWMRAARETMPSNLRVLLNFAQILIAAMQTNGYDAELGAEAREVLMRAEKIAPNQRRFAQLMEQLTVLTPAELA
ncbi:MAG: tetratricopeptide repeat protein [Burkholderiaceae bacterium]|nr:tetratricopeptide repeat protein [Burkholderiaceae bacterium]